jgi:hypothetical protein
MMSRRFRDRRRPGAGPTPEQLSVATLEWVTALKERRLAAMAALGEAGVGGRRLP